ncbi:MAG TPA: restriction endonuclease subunit S [Sedimentisphaerales bacterium]|nr:restriction endonuclease subunit S [Sedimentisphaerales bacterium]
MASDVWSTMPFDQAVQVNPTVCLERGSVYPFVDMQAVDPGSRSVGPSELREFKGGGSRFINGDTLMARITPCLENGKIARYAASKAEEVGHGSTEFIVIRGRPNVTDNGFAYYLTKWDGVRQYCISQMTGSSGRQRVPTSALSHCEVTIPPLKEQQAIACILGALDDKIELNRRMNRTLEEMARAIFKSWFVDFDPVRAKAAVRREHPKWTDEQVSRAACPKLNPEIAALFPDSFEDSELGKIPKGWRVCPIGEVVQVLGGGTPSTKEPAYWEGGIHPFCTPKDMASLTDPVLLQTERHLTDEGLAKVSSGQLPVGTVLLSSRAPIGYLAVAETPVSVNQGIIAMVCDAELPNLYVLHWTKANMDRVLAKANGSTFMEISKRNFRPITAVIPPPQVLRCFMQVVDPTHQRVVSSLRQIQHLADLRDSLLPKLISGELRVPDAERIAGRCV